MDYFAHGFWSYIFFNKSKTSWLAVLFGLLPDSTSWLIYFFVRLFTNGLSFGKPNFTTLPNWINTLYGLSHSLVICGAIFLIVYLVLKRIPIYMFAWPIAIVMDIVTHTKEFLPTPFLYPISNWHFPGISWGTPIFMLINWGLIIGILSYILVKKKWYNKLGEKKK